MSAPIRQGQFDILRLARLGRIGFTVACYTLLAPLGYIVFAVLYVAWRRKPLVRRRRMQSLVALAYRVMHRWLNLVRLTRFDMPAPLEHLPAGACVVVANHPTLMDVTSVLGQLHGACTVAKPGFHERALLRPLLVGSGVIEGPGHDPLAARPVLDEAVRCLHEGFRMVIFPEGTRSPRGRLLPFRRAAFEIACRARVPVVSITIGCEPVWLSKEQPLFDPPRGIPRLDIATIAIDDPAEVDYDSRRLCSLVEGRYEQWIQRRPHREPAAEAEEGRDDRHH